MDTLSRGVVACGWVEMHVGGSQQWGGYQHGERDPVSRTPRKECPEPHGRARWRLDPRVALAPLPPALEFESGSSKPSIGNQDMNPDSVAKCRETLSRCPALCGLQLLL